MSTLLKAGDSEPEQPLREGWLVKQSGGASNRARRRSVGEIMKKWDERYFVLTTQRLYYFKTMEVRSCCPFCRAVSWANAPLRDPRRGTSRQRLLYGHVILVVAFVRLNSRSLLRLAPPTGFQARQRPVRHHLDQGPRCRGCCVPARVRVRGPRLYSSCLAAVGMSPRSHD